MVIPRMLPICMTVFMDYGFGIISAIAEKFLSILEIIQFTSLNALTSILHSDPNHINLKLFIIIYGV